MRAQAIWREALRNVLTGTTRTTTFALILASLTLGLIFAELSTVRNLTDAAAEFQKSGASVVTLQAAERIDGASCEALGQVEGVRAAGAVRSREVGLRAAALPSSEIPVMEATYGFTQVMRADANGRPGVVLSAEAAQTLALTQGDTLIARDGSTRVAGVYEYPNDGRRSGYGYAVIVPVQLSGAFDECWVDVWPTSKEIPSLLQTTLIQTAEESAPPQLTQLNASHGTSFDGTALFGARVTRFAAPTALIASFGLGYLAIRSRRIQLASSLHAGATKRDVFAITFLEMIAWTTPGAVLAFSTLLIYASTGAPEEANSTFLLGGTIAVAALVGALGGASAALTQISERQLFKFFKDR